MYVQCAITQVDQPAILRTAMDHEDQIDTVFARLPEEYKSVVDQVEGRVTAPSITELDEKLLNHEAKLLSLSPSPQTPFPVSANLVHHKNHFTDNNNHNNWYRSALGINSMNGHSRNFTCCFLLLSDFKDYSIFLAFPIGTSIYFCFQ